MQGSYPSYRKAGEYDKMLRYEHGALIGLPLRTTLDSVPHRRFNTITAQSGVHHDTVRRQLGRSCALLASGG